MRLSLAKQTPETRQSCGRCVGVSAGSSRPRKSNRHFDDSSASLSTGGETLLPTGQKSLEEELKEIKEPRRCEKGKTRLTELLGKMYLLERELKTSREIFDKSSKKLLGPHNSSKMLRSRVVDGKLTKMMFTKYTGVKIN